MPIYNELCATFCWWNRDFVKFPLWRARWSHLNPFPLVPTNVYPQRLDSYSHNHTHAVLLTHIYESISFAYKSIYAQMFKTTNMNGQGYVYIFLTAIIRHRQRHAGRGRGASVSVTPPLSLAEMTLRVRPVGVTTGSITHYYSPSHMHTHTQTHWRSLIVV